MTIYITWQEKVSTFKEWRYVGNGVTEPVFQEETVTKRVLYSNDNTMKARAKEYIKTDMQDRPSAKVIIV